MAETQIPVQPATTQGVAPPAPAQLKMVAVPDASGTETQGVTLFDDQGRAVRVMSEETGQRIVQLLSQLVSIMANATGAGLVPSDDTTLLSNPSS